MVLPRLPGLTAIIAATLASALAATHPQVSAVYPRGAKRGTEVTLKIYGARLQEIQGLTFFRPGIVVLEVKPESATRAQCRIRIAQDCALGRHPLLVRTSRGFSNLHMFFIGTLSEVEEKEPNNDKAKCQVVELESTVNGRITSEDLDIFAIDVKQGQRINIEVQGLRLGDQEFDSHLTVEDSQGKRLAVVDDTIFGHLDPLTSLVCKATGRWYITLRENARGGSNTSFYRLHVGTFPRPLVTFPVGGKPGTKTKVRYLGESSSFEGILEFPPPGIHPYFVKTSAGVCPTPLQVVSSGHDNLLERSKAKQAAASVPGYWSMIGPFDNPRDKKGRSLGTQTVYPPEKQFDPKAKYKGRDGEVVWKQQKSLRDNVTCDLRALIKKSDHSVLYLHRTIQASTSRRVLCMLSGDDTIRAWCNGKRVLDDPKTSGVAKDQHRLLLDLQKGRNELLVKITNRSGNLGFYCRFLDPLRIADHRVFSAPVALNGIIEKPGEYDRYVFLARKGEAIDFRVIARRLRSPIDPVAVISCTHQSFYLGNDDTGGMDCLLKFRAPHTGEFVFRVGDMLQSASARHVYRVEVGPPQGARLVTRAALPGYQYEWSVDVPEGGRNALMISTSNLDRRAGTRLSFKGLPAGVVATVPAFAPGAISVPVVFTAKAKTKTQSSLLDVEAKATVKGRKVVGARFRQTVAIVESRNRRSYLTARIEKLPLAVTKSIPFTIDVPEIKVPLIRNSSISVPVDIRWAKDFKGTARIRMLYNPPGITSSQVAIKPGQKRVSLQIYANGSVATTVHKLVLVAMGSVDGANVSTSSEVFDLEVSRPWVEVSVGKVRSTPGGNVSLAVEITRPKKFTGKIETQWIGIPRDIQCGAVEVKPDTAKLTIPVKLGSKAPPGRHRGFRLRLKIHTDKGVVTHDFRSGEIRVDRPVPPRRKTK